MQRFLRIMVFALLTTGIAGCGSGKEDPGADKKEEDSSLVKQRRDDGTLSSVNHVDEEGYVHGVKVNYYEDGKTVHSKVTYEHGRKHGPALWYYKNGQVHEHTNFHVNRKQGLTKKYYDTGELMEEITYEKGDELPGRKRYRKNGDLISD